MKRIRLILIDLVLVAVATIAALYLRDNLTVDMKNVQALLPYLGFTLFVALLVLTLTGASTAIWRFSTFRDYVRILLATCLIIVGAVALTFAHNRLEGVARSLPILQGLLVLIMLAGARVAMRLRHTPRRKAAKVLVPSEGDDASNVLVVGLGPLTDAYLRTVADMDEMRLRVVGILGRNAQHIGRNILRYEILGVTEELDDVLQRLEVHGVTVDRIVVSVPLEQLSEAARDALARVESGSSIRFDYLFERLLRVEDDPKSPVQAAAAPGLDGVSESTTEQTYFVAEALDVEALSRRPYWRLKRLLDIIGALVLIVVMAPVMLAVAVIVALDVGTPVLFWQQRPGLGGRPFRLFKFRTMASGHDRHGRRRSDTERLSWMGRFLRRTRLDELPQLFNILIGEMSFIGPRPLLPIDQAPEYAPRLLVRPGLTGWAQVTGGRDVPADDKAALDIWYVKNASLSLDVAISVKTFRMVLMGERIVWSEVDKAKSDLSRIGVLRVRQQAGPGRAGPDYGETATAYSGRDTSPPTLLGGDPVRAA